MRLGGAGRDSEALTDLFVGAADRDQLDNLPLAIRDLRRVHGAQAIAGGRGLTSAEWSNRPG
jgi:hypothetical protein